MLARLTNFHKEYAMEMPLLRATILDMREDLSPDDDGQARDILNDVLLLIDGRQPGEGWVTE